MKAAIQSTCNRLNASSVDIISNQVINTPGTYAVVVANLLVQLYIAFFVGYNRRKYAALFCLN